MSARVSSAGTRGKTLSADNLGLKLVKAIAATVDVDIDAITIKVTCGRGYCSISAHRNTRKSTLARKGLAFNVEYFRVLRLSYPPPPPS